jgi:hypothetical protein
LAFSFRKIFWDKNSSAANDFRLLRVIEVMKPNWNTPAMYLSRVSMGSMTAVAVIYCVASLAPALASQNGGIAHPSLLQSYCCLAAQTQVVQLPEPGIPSAGTISDSLKTSRTGADHVLSPSWRAPESDIQQAPSFTTGRPSPISGGRWIPGQTDAATGTAERFVTGLTAGDAQLLAFVGSGETENWLAQAPAVDRMPQAGGCASEACADSQGATRDFAVSGIYDPAARAVVSSDSGPKIAQASQTGGKQTKNDPASKGNTKDETVIPDAPAGDSATAGEEFSGSSEPAGPDLSVNEEQSAISQGWK